MKKIFCLIESSVNKPYSFLAKILSLNAIEKTSHFVIMCNEKSKQLIENIPIDYSVTFDFMPTIKGKFDCISQFERMIEGIKYTVQKYGSCLYLNDNLQPIKPLIIPDEILEQGVGFSKKYFNAHDFNDNKKRYSFDILFISNLKFIDNFLQLFIDIDLSCKNIETKTKFRDIYNISPYTLKKQLDIEHTFSCNTIISTSDFFGYKKIITMKNINDDFTINDENPKQKEVEVIMVRDDEEVNTDGDLDNIDIESLYPDIYYVNLDLTQKIPNVVSVNQGLISKLIRYDIFFENIINITNPNNKISLNIPNKNGIGIWDRSTSSPGLYEVFEMIHEIYPGYTSLNNSKSNYFSANFSVITDKPSKEWISNEFTLFKKQFICNYDKSLMDVMRKYKNGFNLNYSFLFLFANHPKRLDNYFYDNKEKNMMLERANESIKIKFINDELYEIDSDKKYNLIQTLNILSKTKHAYIECENLDMNLIIICMVSGCIPVLNCYVHRNYGLRSGVNVFIGTPHQQSKKGYENMKKRIMNFYENKISPKAAFKTLVNKIFVRNIE